MNTNEGKDQNQELAEPEVNTSTPVPTKKNKKRNRRVLNSAILTLVILLVLSMAAVIYVAEPWRLQQIPDTSITVETGHETVFLKVGDTYDIAYTPEANEIITYLSDCPVAVIVDETGLITVNAMHDVTVTCFVREIEYMPPVEPTPSLYEEIRSKLRMYLHIDVPIDISLVEPRELKQYEYHIVVTDCEHIVHEEVIEIEEGEKSELKLDNQQRLVRISDESIISYLSNEESISALKTGKATLTVTYGVTGKANGKFVFMPQYKETYSILVIEKPIPESEPEETTSTGTGSSGGNTSTGGSSGGGNNTGSTGGDEGGGSSGGGSTGGGGGGSTGGGTTTPSRPFPLPSESEVSSFCSQALTYANGLGMGTNSGLNKGNSGFMFPASTWQRSWELVKGDVYWQIGQIYDMLVSEGLEPGMPVIKIIYEFRDGEYDIYVLYG
ncbi:MAG: hypothetical protein FWG21_01295 [Oscillospiraceae bacterium]|nr:hypothetical protein [Oscillospiraceae bacterium]